MNSINYIEQKKNSHLFFKLGDNKYAVNTSNVLEIMKLPMLDYPQKLPNNIVGLLKYNNFVINVIDIRFYLDINVSGYSVDSELLIVKTDETIFGIITDQIIGISPFESSKIDTIPFVDNKTIIDSIYKHNQDTIFIINIYSIENLLKGTIHTEKVDVQELFPKDEQSVAILKSRVQSLAAKNRFSLVSGELHTKKKLISFNLNNDSYCIALDYVKEVLKDSTITNVPGTPDFIEGIMNLRGDYITVLNVKKLLGISSNDSEQIEQNGKKPVIIVSCNDMDLAFLIDKINELFEFPDDKIIETGESYYTAEFIYNDMPYTILNIDKIYTDKRIIVADV